MTEFIPVSDVDENLELIERPKDIFGHWDLIMPGQPPRDSQVKLMEWAVDLPSNIKNMLVQMPVGGGKSPIALVLASYFGQGYVGSSYILTPQRVLQKQYEDSFDASIIHSVYGKANYFCTEKVGLDCDIGADVKPKCATCPAKQAFADIQVMPHVVLNYKLAMLYSEMFSLDAPEFPVRDLMVFDECHTLENHLVSHRAITIAKSRCEDMKISWRKPADMEEAHTWLKEVYYPAVDSKYYELEKAVKEIDNKYEFGGGLLPSEVRTKREFKRIDRHRLLVRKMAARQLDFIESNYVLMRDKNMFQFKEIYGRNLFKNILQPKANKFLFMSSTILNEEAYCSDLGLDPAETEYISLESEFDKDHRPVYFMPASNMKYGWNKPENSGVRNNMAASVKKLCDMHSDESGIIHTGSFQITNWLIKELEGNIPQEIVTHGGDSGFARDEIIEHFMENKGDDPMVIISPSLTEGLDLKDDLARFSIFVKVPFPFLGDEWVKRRLELSDEWYQRQAFQNIIQGGGRVVRTPDDWGNTYILDAGFNNLWSRYKRYVPKWWKEAFSTIK